MFHTIQSIDKQAHGLEQIIGSPEVITRQECDSLRHALPPKSGVLNQKWSQSIRTRLRVLVGVDLEELQIVAAVSIIILYLQRINVEPSDHYQDTGKRRQIYGRKSKLIAYRIHGRNSHRPGDDWRYAHLPGRANTRQR